MLKSCIKCKKVAEHSSGARYCKSCWSAYRKGLKMVKTGQVPGPRNRPKRVAEMEEPEVVVQVESLLETFSDPKKRVAALMAAHQTTLAEYDQLVRDLQAQLKAVRRQGLVTDAHNIAKEMRHVTKARGDYVQRMSEKVELWQGFQDPDPESAPITFVLHELPAAGLVKEMDPGVAKVLAEAVERDGGGKA